MREEWRDIEGYAGLYQVSDFGRVRSVPRTTAVNGGGARKDGGHLVCQVTRRDSGYVQVSLCRNGKWRTLRLSRLVATAFCERAGDQRQVRHLNGDKADNRAANLAWGTAKENALDRDRHGTTAKGVKQGNSKLDERSVREIRKLCASGMKQSDVGQLFNIKQPTVSAIVLRKSWGHVE